MEVKVIRGSSLFLPLSFFGVEIGEPANLTKFDHIPQGKRSYEKSR